VAGVLLWTTPERGDGRLGSAGNGSDGDGACLPVAVDVGREREVKAGAEEAASNRGAEWFVGY